MKRSSRSPTASNRTRTAMSSCWRLSGSSWRGETMDLAALLRVSSAEDYGEQGWGSIETQREKITAWSSVYDHRIVAWYEDSDVSGMIPLELRPQGGRLVREAGAAGAPPFQGVVVYRLDRLGRCFKTIFDGIDILE